MTLPTVVAAGTYTDGVSSTTPGLPAGVQENDILLLFAETDAGAGIGAGGYQLANDAVLGLSTRLSAFWRRVGLSEVTHPVGNGIYLNGAVSKVASCLVVGGIGGGRDVGGATWSGWTNADLANLTERFDDGTTVGTGGQIGVVTGEKAVAGEFRETTLTSSIADNDWGGLQLALAPAGGSLPTFEAAGTSSATDAGTPGTPGLPAGWQENDIFLLFVQSDTVTISAGWEHVPGSPILFGSFGFRVLWRRATASESDPTVDPTGGGRQFSVVLNFRGVRATGVPWDVVSNVSTGVFTALNHISAVVLAFRGCKPSGNPWNIITPDSGGIGTAITLLGTDGAGPTTTKDCLVVAGCSHSNDVAGPTFSGWTNADLANLTERVDDGTIIGNGGGLAVVTGEKAVAGAFGDTTATNSTVAPGWAGFHIALAPGGPRHLPRLGVGR